MDTEPTAKEMAKNAKVKRKALRPWYKKKRFIIPIAVALLAGLSTFADGETEAPGTAASTSSSNPKAASTKAETSDGEANSETPTPATQEEVEESETVGEEQARESAESYLRYSSFSRSGLIDQLLYEGFTRPEAEYAVDAVNADWYEQAALSAESYLSYSSFSREGLIDQLLYEGFSPEEAEYGVDLAYESSGTGSSGAAEHENALESARSYLNFSNFSRSGLIAQLEYEGYSSSAAIYAVDAVGADWFEQAVGSAASYLEYSSFSRSGLLDQLLYEGFTQAEAEYGVEQAYR